MTTWRDKTERHGNGNGSAILPPDLTTPAAVPDPALPPASQPPAVLLAMCLFGEARGETAAAQRAVAQVVLNRAAHAHAVFGSRAGLPFEENLRRVILRPGQFSCFHPSDVNYAKLIRPLQTEDRPVWDRCLRCAEQALTSRNQQDTLTANSDHYFDDSIQPPSWADPAKRTVKLGRLNFYRLYLPAPGSGIPSAEFPPSSDGMPNAAASNPRSSLTPAAARALSADSPSQDPPKQEPSAGRPSPATGLVAGSAVSQPRVARRGITASEVPHTHEPPSPGPAICLGRNDTLSVVSAANAQRRPRTGRLSSLCWEGSRGSTGSTGGTGGRGMFSSLWRSIGNRGTENRGGGGMRSLHRLNPLHPLTLLLPLLPLLFLTSCSDFERAAYRTLAVTQVEYETVQRHVAEAAVHGLISEQQWNRFAVEGHRFIDAHNAAVDAFELWSRSRNQATAARLQALLEILPRLVLELNNLAESFEENQETEDRSQESEAGCQNQNPNACHPEERSDEGSALLLAPHS